MVFRVWLVKNAIWIVSSFKDSQWRYENVCDLKSSVIVAPLKCKIYYLQQIHTCNFVAKNPSLPHKNKCITFGSFTFLAASGFDLVCVWLFIFVSCLTGKCIQGPWSLQAVCDGDGFFTLGTHLHAVLTPWCSPGQLSVLFQRFHLFLTLVQSVPLQ